MPATTSPSDLAFAESLRSLLPDWLLAEGPRGLARWQWGTLPLLALASWGAGMALAWALRRLFTRAVRSTGNAWDDALLERSRGPLALLCALAVFLVAMPILALDGETAALLRQCVRAGFLVALFWMAARSVSIAGVQLERSSWAAARPAARGLLPLAVRMGQIATIGLAAITVLSELGFPVASLLAGLGIGGLALALAAQKTVENLFGSLALGVDQPILVGDFVRVEEFVGTVESIGLRSTRIRTLDRTLVTIPNGKLADMRLETFAARDRMRLACTVSLTYGTTAAQMRAVLAGLEEVLRRHPLIWPDAVVVRFKELAASSLDVEVMAWFQTQDWGEFQLIRQEVLLSFIDIVERSGSSFAFPTRTVHVVGGAVGAALTGSAPASPERAGERRSSGGGA